MGHYRALAIDYDGTLTEGERPEPRVLEALRATRGDGRKVVLVTGRILERLREVFPGVDDHFDAIVAENGAVLSRDGDGGRGLAAPVSRHLAEALERRGIPLERGHVLLALAAEHDLAAEAEIGRLGLECHLSRNRGSLMILPAGVSKGAGLGVALAELGISPHSALAVGDAENDHSLVDVCELGVAVANAVPALKAHADVVLDEANGAGIRALLDGPIFSGEMRLHPRRWNAELGTFPDGEPATVPGSQANLLVTGEGGSGKSELAGLLVERLVALGYTLCVLDAEGEHAALGQLRGVAATDRRSPLPGPEQIRRLVLHRLGSLVVDLSSLRGEGRAAYLAAAWDALRRERAETGLPHWVVVDGAQLLIDTGSPTSADLSAGGYCLVARDVDAIRLAVLAHVDILVARRQPAAHLAATLAALGGRFDAELPDPLPWEAPDFEEVALLSTRGGGPPRPFTPAHRASAHLGRWRSGAQEERPAPLRFVFRGRWGVTGRSAGNAAEFHRELERAGPDVVQHHVTSGDFSRWARAALDDEELGAALAAVEQAATGVETVTRGVVEEWRRALLRAIDDRHR